MAVSETSYAIVAIPNQDDYVWNLSSEKVPHLTICYLGEQLDNVSHVQDFIAHVVDTSMHRFGLSVERRGVLGDKSADVLFFENDPDAQYSEMKILKDFRTYLFNNPDIFKAYNSVEQYPEWTPHLTMGYPETPAKPDKRDYPGTSYVFFDRIALWTSDYAGVEFPLKRESYGDLAMASAKGSDFLQHYGVKGMKWGVVRERLNSGAVGKAKKLVESSEDHKKAAAVRTKAKIAGVNTLSNKELQEIITRMNLETQFKTLKTVEHEQSLVGKGKKWAANFVTDVLKDTAASWLRRPGSDPSGRTSARAYAWGHQVGEVIEGNTVNRKAIGR